MKVIFQIWNSISFAYAYAHAFSIYPFQPFFPISVPARPSELTALSLTSLTLLPASVSACHLVPSAKTGVIWAPLLASAETRSWVERGDAVKWHSRELAFEAPET